MKVDDRLGERIGRPRSVAYIAAIWSAVDLPWADVPARNEELEPKIISVALGRDSAASAASQRAAFAQLYEHYEPRVRYAVARAAVKAAYKHHIEDLRQEVWCRFSRRTSNVLSYYDASRGTFGSFLMRLAYQQALAAIHADRRQAPDGETALDDTYEDDAEDPQMTEVFAVLIQSDFYDKLMVRAQGQLDPTERTMVKEIYFNGHSALWVARTLGINKNTIHKRHQRLKKKLRSWAEELMSQLDPPKPPPGIAAVITLLVASLAHPAMDGTDPSPASALAAPDDSDPLPPNLP